MHPRGSLPVALGLLLGVAACGDEGGIDRDPRHSVHSVLENLASNAWDTGVVVFGKRGKALEPYGWHAPERDADGHVWRWMEGERSGVELFLEAPVDGTLELFARAPLFLEEQQVLTVRVNGHELGTVVVPRKAARLHLPVAADQLRAGENEIRFEASASGRPSEANQRDSRLMSVGMSHVALIPADEDEPPVAGPSLGMQGDVLVLHPGQIARTGITVPEGCQLELELEAPRSTELEVAVGLQGDGQLVLGEVLDLGSGTTARQLDLSLLAGQHVTLAFSVPRDERPVRLGDVRVSGLGLGTNVIFVVVDTLRADYTFGENGVQTPALEALARDGLRFRGALSHAPMTLPSHTTLFSSRYPHVNGVTNNGQRVPSGVPLLADWLKECGYHTTGVVSIGTLWTSHTGTGVDRGFLRYDDTTKDLPQAHQTKRRLWPVLDDLGSHEPFFLFAHFSDPHSPYNAHGSHESTVDVFLDGALIAQLETADMQTWIHTLEAEPGEHVVTLTGDQKFKVERLDLHADGERARWEKVEGAVSEKLDRFVFRFENTSSRTQEVEIDLWIHDTPARDEVRRRYALEVAHVDRVLSEFFRELKSLGLYEDSLIVFTSDHGEGLGEHGIGGHVGGLWEEQVHVPFLLKLPRGQEPPERLVQATDTLVRHLDVVPTVLDLLMLPPMKQQMGLSLLEEGDRPHFAETHAPEAKEDILSLRDDRYKLIYFPAREEFELYDLVADPEEKTDRFEELGAQVQAWQEQLMLMGTDMEDFDPEGLPQETLDMLRELGYVGDDEE